MAPLASICLVVLVAVPALQEGMPTPNTTTSLEAKTPTSLQASVTSHRKAQSNATLCQNNTDPVPCSTFNHKNYVININGSRPCVFRCSYNPEKLSPLRFEVHQRYKHPAKSPTFVSVQQNHYISCWTLPIISPTRGQDQKFTSLESLLCPPANETNEVVEVSISVRGSEMKKLQVSLTNVSFILQKETNVTVTVTPVSSWYKLYQWEEKEKSVLITANSKSDICAVLILQNAKCPVSSELSGLMNRGRYQTFTLQAGMVAHRAEFPDGVHVIVVSLPDDDACFLSPIGSEHNGTRDSRTKTVVLEAYNHATMASTWYIFALTAAFLVIVTTGLSMLICASIKRTLRTPVKDSEDARHLMGEEVEDMGGEYSAGETQPGQCDIPSGLGNGCAGQVEQGVERGEGAARQDRLAIEASEPIEGSASQDACALLPSQLPCLMPATTHAPVGENFNITHYFNPRFMVWWKSVAVYEAKTAEAHVSEVGFQNSLVIMGVFAALPVSELLRSYLGMVLHHGREDQCFWNSRCLTAFGFLPDAARVFTNLGYILLGVAFVLIVGRHKALTHDILRHCNVRNSVGVSHNYGLYVSLGYALVMQGVMSALYHTCPNSVTIKFDMMFMYVMMVVAVVSIWGLRHGDVTHHVYPTVITVGLALLAAEGRAWLSHGWFWGLLSTVYIILLLSNAVLMASYGIWSFSLSKLWHVWNAWKVFAKRLRNVLKEQDTSSRPMEVIRVTVGVVGNIGLVLFGILEDPDVYNFILIVCLVNMGLYFANYVMMKRLTFGEKGTLLAWVCLALSFVLWVVALAFFFQRRTDSESSPATSRIKNSPCDFLYVFDDHDVWHFTSSFALFFFFVALLTMDDDLCHKRSEVIRVA